MRVKRKLLKMSLFIPISGMLIIYSTIAFGATIHVPEEYPTIQAAIDAAVNGDTVLVADGIYTGPGNKDLDFDGKGITLISENGPDNCVIDCEFNGRGFYFHSGELQNSVLSGLNIINGNANQGAGIYCKNSSPTISNCSINNNIAEAKQGGGIYCENSSPTISDCLISGNIGNDGGGIYCKNSSPTITLCTISGNFADYYGGGIHCYAWSSPVITYCSITGNIGESRGGGIYCDNSSPDINNCTISGNNTAGAGGGIYCTKSSPSVTNCGILENIAEWDGGGIYCDISSPTISNSTINGNMANNLHAGGIYCETSSPTITNCIISDNIGDDSGGIYCCDLSSPNITYCTISMNAGGNKGNGIFCENSSPTINNCIIWDNSTTEIYLSGGSPIVTYSDIKGGSPGEGNIDKNPMFVGDGDYHANPGSPCLVASEAGAEIGAYGNSPNNSKDDMLSAGWNLLGLKSKQTKLVTELISDNKNKILSVWKWKNTKWAVFLPKDGLEITEAYATSKGFNILYEINPGQGFWVNCTEAIALE